MKKVISILLIAVHLLGVGGCYGLFAYLENRYENKLSVRLDDDEYVGSDAVILRIPYLSDGYSDDANFHSDNENYHRTEGKVLLQGEVYQLVKQKFHKGTLYIVCVKDNASTELRATLQDYSAALGDQLPESGSKGKTAGKSVQDFFSVQPLHLNQSTFLISNIRLPGYSFSEKLNSDFSVDQPPKI